MKIMVSAFDDKLADYGVKMYRSFARFNPGVPMFFCDYGDMTRTAELEALGVKLLRAKCELPKKHPRFRDMMLLPFLEDVPWDGVLWIDADTLVLRPLGAIWEIDADIIGHPDRADGGLLRTCDYDKARHCCIPGTRWQKFASGVWATRQPAVLLMMWNTMLTGRHAGRDSDVLTAVANCGEFTAHQLDGNFWNFGRQLIPLAENCSGRVVACIDGNYYRPYVAAFSRVPVDGKDIRPRSAALDKFYRETICNDFTNHAPLLD